MTREEAYEQLYASHNWKEANAALHFYVRAVDQVIVRKVGFVNGTWQVLIDDMPWRNASVYNPPVEYATAYGAKNAVERAMVDKILAEAAKWTEAAEETERRQRIMQQYPPVSTLEPEPSLKMALLVVAAFTALCFLAGWWMGI